MSTFDHANLIQGITESLGQFRKSQPDAMQGFGQLAKAAMSNGVISEKNKELIALAIGVAARCDGCIGFHTQALIKLGVTKLQLAEMLGVAVMMGGGPSLMYAAEAMRAYEEFGGQ